LEFIKRLVGQPKRRQIGKHAPLEDVIVPAAISQTDMEALKRLRNIGLAGIKASDGAKQARGQSPGENRRARSSKQQKSRNKKSVARVNQEEKITFLKPKNGRGSRLLSDRRTFATIAVLIILPMLAGQVVNAESFQVNIQGVSVTFERRMFGDRVDGKKIPANSPINMEITARVGSTVTGATLIDYFPKGWTVIDARGGTVSSYDKKYNKIEWSVGTVSDSVTRSYVVESSKPTKVKSGKLSLKSELIYDGGSAFLEDWVEILVEKAAHLDENRDVISDIYAEIRVRDDVWSEPIYEGEWVRITFEKELTSANDITFYARNTLGLSTRVEVYLEDDNEKIAEFPVITNQGYYKVYLAGMEGSHATFDLKVVNFNPETAYLEFDHIVDPENTYYYVVTENVWEGGGDNLARAQASDGLYENIFENNYQYILTENKAMAVYYDATTIPKYRIWENTPGAWGGRRRHCPLRKPGVGGVEASEDEDGDSAGDN